MDDLEILLWMEKRYGPLSKTIPDGYSMDKVDQIEKQLVTLLQKYKEQLKLNSPMPRIRMWTTENKVNFLFFDKETGKRVLLGEWLSGKEGYYEH